MSHSTDIAVLAASIGDPGRARMLDALMADRALTAKELAYVAHLSASTASAHLARLVDCGLVVVAAQGRHRYFRLAGPQAARLLEELGGLAAAGEGTRRRPQTCRDPELRRARTCYDHLAGRLGVALAEAVVGREALREPCDHVRPTAAGTARLRALGLGAVETGGLPPGRTCLDWSERRPHLGGALGRALLARLEELGWLARAARGRALVPTTAGARELTARFDLDPELLQAADARYAPA
jgi:DNA-binding transcriptional ArsR family regulator